MQRRVDSFRHAFPVYDRPSISGRQGSVGRGRLLMDPNMRSVLGMFQALGRHRCEVLHGGCTASGLESATLGGAGDGRTTPGGTLTP